MHAFASVTRFEELLFWTYIQYLHPIPHKIAAHRGFVPKRPIVIAKLTFDTDIFFGHHIESTGKRRLIYTVY